MIPWLLENKEWVFSGIGLAVVATITSLARWMWKKRESGPHRRIFLLLTLTSPIILITLHYIIYRDYWHSIIDTTRFHFITLPLITIFTTAAISYWLIGYRVRQLRLELVQLRLSDNFQDPLTKIPNIKALEHIFIEKTNLAKDTGNPLSALLIDVDNFKRLNDKYGMEQGDYALSHIATLIEDAIRPEDAIVRYKMGDEFFLILYRTTGANAENAVASRLLEYIRNMELKTTLDSAGKQEEVTERLTVSIVVTEIDPFNDSLQNVKGRVEQGLIKAKQTKDTIVRIQS